MCFPQGKMSYSKQSQKRVPDHQRPVLSGTFISQPSLSRGPTIDMLRLLWKQSNLLRARSSGLALWHVDRQENCYDFVVGTRSVRA